MQNSYESTRKAWTSFFAIWLLSGLILGVVHGASIGTLFGLGIASGYLAAARIPVLLAQRRRRLQRRVEVNDSSAEPHRC
jgi:hypothetical protein